MILVQTTRGEDMNVIFLSPNFPYNFKYFCKGLKDTGINAFGIDQMHFHDLNEILKSSLTGYYRVNDLHYTEELIRACEYFRSQFGSIDRIESHNEYWLQTQAYLTDYFKIPNFIDQIENVKRKSRMKVIFKESGMNPARGGLIPTLDSALNLIEEFGYPVMAKPDIGVGAGGCYKINNEVELRNFFTYKPLQDYLLEEYIYGDIYTFDGLVDREGKIIYCTSHVYNAGIAEIVNHQLDPFYYSLRELPPDLEKIRRDTIKAYQIKESFFHLEYFRRHDNQCLVPIEVNKRPPGGYTLDMCNYASDIDLYRLWAEMVADRAKNFKYHRKYHCMAISRRNKNNYTASHEEIMKNSGDMIVHHEAPPSTFSTAMGNYCYIARSPDLEELMNLQKRIQHH